ncbi:GLYCOSYL TRANSFERASE FAMILY 1 PROTEIN [Salix viminalis]|uniref:GLYCOSYL TRANSFERASE FAMILY 1 PROTEIN n=1 Tax=Salix viminalis TaxID=40686 RepID=A0A9Q0TYL0_SALVM|nr:GLYCOSYL TRANSFERASE FAMILY 1 PROTEIN [Salix viminalis]
MNRNHHHPSELPDSPAINVGSEGVSDQNFHSIRDRFLFKRNPNPSTNSPPKSSKSPPDRLRRWHHYTNKSNYRKGGWFSCIPFRGIYLLYFVIFFAVLAFVFASILLQSSITGMVVFSKGWVDYRRSIREGLKSGTTLRFVPGLRSRLLLEGHGLDHVREQANRVGLRPPRLAVILGNMKKDPQSLMLLSVMKNLQKLGYELKIYALGNGETRTMWEDIGGRISILRPKQYELIDWSIFEGVIVDSLEAKEVVSSLTQEPFQSIPLVWIIQEDTLANRLPVYQDMNLQHLVSHWRNTFNRANVVVFPDFALPMLYSVLDTGNFLVIPGSPVDVWAAESYSKTHDKHQLRVDHGFSEDDLVVLVVGSSFFYDELSWDYTVALHTLGPILAKYARSKDAEGSFKFVFLCGNSTDDDAFQEVVSHLGLHHSSVRHYGLNGDANSVLLVADIVLYGSSQDEQGFPPVFIRAMTLGIPVIAPDIPTMKKYVSDGAHGILLSKYNLEALTRAFSLLISNGKLSKYAETVAFSGRLLAKNMLASECITGYARLLENMLSFPSDTLLPWSCAWTRAFFLPEKPVLFIPFEKEWSKLFNSTIISENGTEILVPDIPTKSDWDVLMEIESFEEYERVVKEELEERMDKTRGLWDDIYRNARKSEKLKFEANERDEGELERTGQPVCIYEIYDGAGAWPLLHHGSLYRGLSLSTKARRSRSDDVDAVARLPLLNESYYKNMLCEIGGMFSIAIRVDGIHKRPWIGFQSWHAAGRKVSLSFKAEKVLEEKTQEENKDVMYFWARLGIDGGVTGSNEELSFWSMCDVLNGGHCRTAFEDAFRQMYGLPSYLEALPPMPQDGGHWSALHSWVMPTPSFLEFIMFSRMFVDSLDALQSNSSQVNKCLLSLTVLEEKHCYCRIMEVLVNVWAYHSARKMVYIDPHTGSIEEQHPIKQRKGITWKKYFNLTVLKSMDEDLAEAADDGDHPRERWLWPLTGEVHWQGIYEREREERYRIKMDKKRKIKEKLVESFTVWGIFAQNSDWLSYIQAVKHPKPNPCCLCLPEISGLYAKGSWVFSIMHAIKGGWVGQTFALAKSNDSGGKKSRIRRSKEERKGMVESFIKKYQSLNNGNFPSLNLTHKEVGGSFYTVREIVREIIQENRVLGPGKLPLEEQYNDLFVEQYPLGTISTEPLISLSISPNGRPEPDHHESSSEALDLISEQHAEPEQQGFDNGKIINRSHVIVKIEEADKPRVVEVQVTEPLETEKRMEEVAASRAKVTQIADVMVETFPLPPATRPAENLNGNSSNVRDVNGILEDKDVGKVLLEPEQDPRKCLVDDKEVEKPAVPLLEQGFDLASEKAVENLAVLAMGSSNASVTKEGIVQDAEANIDVKVKSSHDEKANAETNVIDAQNGIQTISSTVGSSQLIAKEVEMKDEASFQHREKQSSSTLNRINL